jgi:hypothetical protein
MRAPTAQPGSAACLALLGWLLLGLSPARASEPRFLAQDGVRLEHPAGRERAARAFLEAALALRTRIQADLGAEDGGPVRIVLAEDLAQMRALAPPGSRVPSWAAGLAFPTRGLVLLRLDSRVEGADGLERVLAHELAHLLLARATGFSPLSRWFHEGYAVYAAGEWSFGRTAALTHGALANRLFTLEELDDSFPESAWEAELAYAQSIDFVAYLLGRGGRTAFHRLIGLLREGWPLVVALEEAYDTGFGELERAWRADVSRRTTWIPLLTGTGVLWSLGAVALGAAFLRRRRARRLALALSSPEDHEDQEPPAPPLTPWSP